MLWDDRFFDLIRAVVERKELFAVFSLLLVSSVVTDHVQNCVFAPVLRHINHTLQYKHQQRPARRERAKEKEKETNSKMWSRLKSGNYRFVRFGQLNNLLRSFLSYLDYYYYYLCWPLFVAGAVRMVKIATTQQWDVRQKCRVKRTKFRADLASAVNAVVLNAVSRGKKEFVPKMKFINFKKRKKLAPC